MDLKKEERYYHPEALNRWFAISSLLFLAAIVGMFANDYIREWKDYQREFRTIDVALTKDRIDNTAIDIALKEQLETNRDAAEAELVSHQDRLDELAALIVTAEGEFYWANMNYQSNAADLDEARYLLEHSHAEGHFEPEIQENFDEIEARTNKFELQAEESQTEIDSYEAEVATLELSRKDARTELATLLREVSLLERKLSLIDPASMTTANRIANVVRDLPVIDFLAPSIKIEQIIVNDIRDDVNFAAVPKVDRCTSCHLGIDKVGFEDAAQPFTTHPNLNLYLKSSAPHPMNEFGCTSCHAGRGRGTSFTAAGHMPSSDEQAEEWEHKYGWEPLEFWEEKIFPSRYSEAGCLKCHAGEPTIKDAEQLTLGLAIMEKAACYGCHAIERFEDWERRGPNLAVLSNKIDKDFAYKWIRNPRSFRHSTWMPSFFNQTNNSSADDNRRTNAEIHAITNYLFGQSETVAMPASVRSGSAARGEALFTSVGCQGCHVIEPEPTGQKTTLDRMFQRHGPNLAGLGSKTSAEWVYNWVKNPTFYNENTRMPNLRLSNQEAGDITAYVMTLRNEAFESIPVPELDEEELGNIAYAWLAKNATAKDAQAEVESMSLDETLNFVGRRAILHYGCFSCHNIPGFEDAKPIGTPLTFEGSKPGHNLDFGSVHEINHTNYNWFEAKLTNPRIFDRDKVKPYDERLRMPNFNLSPTEVQAVTTALLGLVKSNVHPDKMADADMDELIVNRGMTIIKDYNCQGCHIINGQGGQIVDIIGDPALSPPNLNTEGAKAQADWLFRFFKSPTTIRPNLDVRMPTYSLTDAEWNDIIRAFQFSDGATTTFAAAHDPSKSKGDAAVGAFLASKEMGDCAKCHVLGGVNPTSARSEWAPELMLARDRLKPEWVVEWLRDPSAIMPGTKMPQPYIPSKEDVTFDGASDYFPGDLIRMAGDDEALLESIRDYVYTAGGK